MKHRWIFPVLWGTLALFVGVEAMSPSVATESFDCLESRCFWSFLSVAFECSKFSSSFQRFVGNPVAKLEPGCIQRARDFQPKFTPTGLSHLLGYVAYIAGTLYCWLSDCFAFSLGLESKRPYVSTKLFNLMERHSLRNFLLHYQLSFVWTWLEKML